MVFENLAGYSLGLDFINASANTPFNLICPIFSLKSRIERSYPYDPFFDWTKMQEKFNPTGGSLYTNRA